MSKKLSNGDRAHVHNAYEEAMNVPQGSARSGVHMFLIAALSNVGVRVNSTAEALQTAEKLLYPSYKGERK